MNYCEEKWILQVKVCKVNECVQSGEFLLRERMSNCKVKYSHEDHTNIFHKLHTHSCKHEPFFL